MAAIVDQHPHTEAVGTSPMPPAILDVHDVTVAYHRKPVLWNVDLTIRRPRLIGGVVGCGDRHDPGVALAPAPAKGVKRLVDLIAIPLTIAIILENAKM